MVSETVRLSNSNRITESEQSDSGNLVVSDSVNERNPLSCQGAGLVLSPPSEGHSLAVIAIM